MKPFEFVDSKGPFGDATSMYNVRFNKKMTVQELIDYVLTQRRKEWGYIVMGNWPKGHRLEYRYGGIVSDNLTEAEKRVVIKQMFASGGWSAMDYIINDSRNPFLK